MKLAPLLGTPGLQAAALVGRDGLPLELQGEGGDLLAAELAALRSTFSRLSRRLGSGTVTRLSFTSEGSEVVAVVSGNCVLGAALARGSDTRAAMQALARVAAQLALPQGAGTDPGRAAGSGTGG